MFAAVLKRKKMVWYIIYSNHTIIYITLYNIAYK